MTPSEAYHQTSVATHQKYSEEYVFIKSSEPFYKCFCDDGFFAKFQIYTYNFQKLYYSSFPRNFLCFTLHIFLRTDLADSFRDVLWRNGGL